MNPNTRRTLSMFLGITVVWLAIAALTHYAFSTSGLVSYALASFGVVIFVFIVQWRQFRDGLRRQMSQGKTGERLARLEAEKRVKDESELTH